MKYKPRQYQIDGENQLRKWLIENPKTNGRKTRPILCMPTGSGKTVTFASIVEGAQRKGKRVLVVAHRRELIVQARRTLTEYGVNPLLMHYFTVQTLVRSPHKIPDVDLCIIDECHIGNFRALLDLLPPNVQVIGVTATPISSSNKHPLREDFDHVISPISIGQLINDRYLSQPTYQQWSIDESRLNMKGGDYSEASQAKVFSIADLLKAYEMRVGKTIIFASSIDQVNKAHEAIPEAMVVHSRMSQEAVDAVVVRYKNTPDATIINCGILTAGFDDPWIETVIIWRATVSLSLYMQMIGRGSRVVEVDGVYLKFRFYVYDLGGNVKRHLAWEVERDWEQIFRLQGMSKKEKAANLKECVVCTAKIFSSTKICPYCASLQPVKEKADLIADKIEVISSFSELPENMRKPVEEMTVAELIERAQYGSPRVGRPYKIDWIVRQLKDRPDSRKLITELARIKGYKRGWVERQVH